jgi:hypothetical protein
MSRAGGVAWSEAVDVGTGTTGELVDEGASTDDGA